IAAKQYIHRVDTGPPREELVRYALPARLGEPGVEQVVDDASLLPTEAHRIDPESAASHSLVVELTDGIVVVDADALPIFCAERLIESNRQLPRRVELAAPGRREQRVAPGEPGATERDQDLKRSSPVDLD